MAALLRNSKASMGIYLPLRRWVHSMPPPLSSSMGSHLSAISPPMVLPESDDAIDNSTFSFIDSGNMELMAVPKKKVSKHKRGIRNGPKALKPVPVIIRCRACGRVKLPHYFCCSGIKQNPGEHSGDL